MRKIGIIVLVFVFLCIGLFLGDTSNIEKKVTQNELDKFEEYLKDNEYEKQSNNLNPNILNKVGRKIEDFIDKGFNKIFGFFK